MTKQAKKESLVRELGYLISVEGEHYILTAPNKEPIGMFTYKNELIECAIKHYKS